MEPISKTEDRKQKTAKSWQKIQPTFSTMVENPLQIGTILKNKANLQRVQMSISLYEQKDYEEKSRFWLEKNKANSKPISRLGNQQDILNILDRPDNLVQMRLSGVVERRHIGNLRLEK